MGVIMILLLGGVCLGGWRFQYRRRVIRCHTMDIEMDALRRAIADEPIR
jgi:hypothetical protein